MRHADMKSPAPGAGLFVLIKQALALLATLLATLVGGVPAAADPASGSDSDSDWNFDSSDCGPSDVSSKS